MARKKIERPILTCPNCNITFKPKRIGGKYCSKNCASVYLNKTIHREGNIGRHHTEEHKQYMSDKMMGRKFSDETIKNMTDNHWSKSELREEIIKRYKENYWDNEEKSKEARNKMSLTRLDLISDNFGNFFGTKGHYVSSKTFEKEVYDSLFELKRMIDLDKDKSVVSWTKKHKIKIEFEDEKGKHNFLPDFLIEYKSGKVLEELKSTYTDSAFKAKNELKSKAMIQYCQLNNIGYNWNVMLMTYEERKKVIEWLVYCNLDKIING